MNLPFSTEQFLDVFARYNEAVWPAQYFLNAIAVVASVLAFTQWRHAARVGASLVGVMWLWAGIAYHWLQFTRINPAAWFFGALFAFQAAMMFRGAVSWNGPVFTRRWTVRRVAGAAIIVYALAAYPVLGHFLGHRYPNAPTFGAPCPVTLLTLGFLLLAEGHDIKRLTVIPILWAALGSTAVFHFGMKEDIGLLVVTVPVAWLVFRQGGRSRLIPESGQDTVHGRQPRHSRIP